MSTKIRKTIFDTEYIILDTETTGAEDDDKVIEVAMVRFKYELNENVNPDNSLLSQINEDGSLDLENLITVDDSRDFNGFHCLREKVTNIKMYDLEQSLIDPEKPIKPAASAVHYLTDDDVIGNVTIETYRPKLESYLSDSILLAHNAKFDMGMLPFIKNEAMCTLKLARLVLSVGDKNHNELPLTSHKVQEIRYWAGLNKIDTMGLLAHRAAADIIVTAHVLKFMLDKYVLNQGSIYLDDFREFLNSPIYVEKMPFGKHKGKYFKEVDRDYFWYLLQKDDDDFKEKGKRTMDENLRMSIESYLASNKKHVALQK